ncbi:hypothetical protein LCGC14_1751490 [marine sediment metagenome]|uniref:Uncharacterized protein n=1 Tax=marine sediment metagenome TaxID=412755 RepID=A0A0F9JIT5_9ZZZZ
MENLIDQIESCDYECQAGPLTLNVDWQKLKEVAAIHADRLWVIQFRGQVVQHTAGYGGWRYWVFTNKKEGEALASEWQHKICECKDKYEVVPLLSAIAKAKGE